jgi:hypothetical protein
MKLLVAVFPLLLFTSATDTLLIVDKDLRKPVGHTNNFTTQLYLQRNFPVYASETTAIIEATDKAVRWIESEQPCQARTEIKAGHTTITIQVFCDGGKKINLTLMTEVEESQTSFSFALARNEYDLRKAQRRLLDFATYISQ